MLFICKSKKEKKKKKKSFRKLKKLKKKNIYIYIYFSTRGTRPSSHFNSFSKIGLGALGLLSNIIGAFILLFQEQFIK